MPIDSSNIEENAHKKLEDDVSRWFHMEFFYWLKKLFDKYDNSFLIV